ncbi:MAG: tRNA (N(6)-L-threonylcarbamoyladenosine(37)-C(2))-methylthiotransferase MtaB [Acidobacteriota bacterium]|nr:tRNA (N(6)-L-threonylcarbamoyladenosine(37)-C(2))-methylthiotransferase MtaB [Acidobacteriota bacterium]
MATFSIENFGCRATEADASEIRLQLAERGLVLLEDHARAEVVVLNTCTVTAAADSQAREAIRKIHRANPAARIIVTGCYAQRAPEELAALEGVEWVVGNSHRSAISRLACNLPSPLRESAADFVPLAELCDAPGSLARGPAKILTADIFAQTAVDFAAPDVATRASLDDRTRPILKIQDGCNNRCSYCVIPFVRGRSRSVAPDAVIKEVHRLAAAGAKEVVLSGINLGSYGRDLAPRATLAGIVRRMLDETSIDQIRFSSIEPQDVTEDFVSLAARSDRIAPHFHIPLQSGSDRILRAMRRWYRAEHYAERVLLIYRMLPHAAIGADVIAGFPGESPADFRATYEFIERLPFTYLHVFSFSARPGTAAEHLADAVRGAEIRERARALRLLARKKAEEFRSFQGGRSLRALTLNRRGNDWTEALTGNYLKLRIAGLHPANEWHQVRVTGDPETAIG